MRHAAIAIALFVIGASAAWSEEIVLKDGRRLYGSVREVDGQLMVEDGHGNATVLEEEVAQVRGMDQLRQDYRNLLRRDEGNRDPFALGCWCWKRGLIEEGRSHFREVLEKDPENRGARWALGYLKVGGTWVESGRWTKLPDRKKTWVRWMPKGLKGRMQVRLGEAPNDARDLLRKSCTGPFDGRDGFRETFDRLVPAERREGLLLGLRDKNPNVRCLCADLIRWFSDDEAVAALSAAALTDRVEKVRQAAVSALATAHPESGSERMASGLGSERMPVRLNAIEGLGAFKTRNAVDVLVAVLGSDKPRLPRVNIFIGGNKAFVGDVDVEVASRSGIGDPIIASQMEGVVLDVKVVNIRMRIVRLQRCAARRSLIRIAGKDLGGSADRWRKWAEEEFGS